MRTALRKAVIAATAVVTVAVATVALPSSAEARWRGGWHGGGWHGGHWHRGGWGWGAAGLAIGTGLATLVAYGFAKVRFPGRNVLFLAYIGTIAVPWQSYMIPQFILMSELGLSNTLRASLHSWSKTLSDEVGRAGVPSNIIVPGRIETDRTRFLDQRRASSEGRPADDVMRDSAASIALGRYGRPEEYADVAAFLCSERASYITGSVVRVDGGMTRSVG